MNIQIQNTINELLQKYIENKCTENELYVLLNYLKLSDTNKVFEPVSHSFWQIINSEDTYLNEEQIKELNTEVNLIFKQIEQKNKVKKKKRTIWPYQLVIRVVAMLLWVFGMGLYLTIDKEKPSQITYEEITTGRGETKEITLTDGTCIILNSVSQVTIPSDFNQNNRCISMDGEAFFDVSHNPDQPFIIKNASTQVKVLGTSFNVKSYDEDEYINVTVSTGKVQVNIQDLNLQLLVSPLEHLSVNKQTGTLTKLAVKENKYAHWKDGALYFNKEPISEVIKNINRKYDMDVVLECKDCKQIISGSHDNKSLESVIKSICFTTGLKYKKNGEKIILYE